MCAAHAGHFETVKLLVKHGADLAVTNNEGKTAEHIALARKQYEVAAFLKERRALLAPSARGAGAARSAEPAQCSLPGKPTLAVLDVVASGYSRDQAGLFSEALRSEIVKTQCFRVQSTAQMREILATQKVNASEVCDESCVVEAGRLLQVAQLAAVRISRSEGGAWTVGTITDVESGTVLKSARVKLPVASDDAVLESFPDVVRQLVE